MPLDDFGPLYPSRPPAEIEPTVIDAKFKVVLSPFERFQRRLNRFEMVGTWIGGLLAAALMLWVGPYIYDFTYNLISPMVDAVFGAPQHR